MRILRIWNESTILDHLRANKAAFIFLLILCLGMLTQVHAHAGVRLGGLSDTATSTTRFVNAKAASGGDGTSWAKAFRTIQPAVDAVAAAGGGEVWVAEGSYYGTGTGNQIVLIWTKVKVYGGFTGTESVLAERNPATHRTIIDGYNNRSQGVYNYGLLDGFVVQRGKFDWQGGGIYNCGTVTNCTVANNSTTFSDGGGIFNNFGTVTNCTVMDNSAPQGEGGGIYNYCGIVANCVVIRCLSEGAIEVMGGGRGGGIYNDSGIVTNCLVAGNSATFYGDGIYNYGTVANCTVTGNFASKASRGGIYNGGSVKNCIVWHNGLFDITGTLNDVTYSCFGEATGANHNLRANPRFVSTTGSNPQSWDLRLLPDSPCIDAGTTTNTVTQTLAATDLAGNPRIGGDEQINMGAYESPDDYTPGAPAPPVVLYVSPQSDSTTGQDWSKAIHILRYAISAANSGYDLYEIRVAAGTYREDQEIITASRINSISGGWSGNPANPEERDIARFKTIVDGGKTHRCLTNYILLDGLWIQNGLAYNGGGILNYGTVTNCTVSSCTVTLDSVSGPPKGNGGGIYNYGTVTNCMVTSNSAVTHGGGILNASGRVEDCIVANNTASDDGGGIYNDGITLNCAVMMNTASNVGGIFNDKGLVANSIVWRNRVKDLGGDLNDVSYSCFGEATEANHNLRANPRFVSSSGNDPLAWDLRLLPDSPCIDSGTMATTATQALAATDRAGNPRPGEDGRVDMGAYESPDDYTPGAPAPPVVLYVSPQGDGSTGQDWAKAFNTITSATQAVVAGDDLYEIHVAAGTYRESREITLLANRLNSLSGGWSGNSAQPEERNIAVFKSIIDGEKTHRCLTNYTLLDGLWIQNGSADSGGGVLNRGTVANCTVTSSTAHGKGGGIYNYDTVTNCTVADCAVTSNSRTNGAGGGIYNDHGMVANCTVTGNTAASGTGGGIYNDQWTMPNGMVTNCMVTDNSAASGGGINNYFGTVAYSTIMGNSSVYSGGGLYNYGTVANCMVMDNTASDDGGGIINFGKMVNCVVANNTASSAGGGIYNCDTITNCTVTSNTASIGGDGIYNYYALQVENCIVWRNGVKDLGGKLDKVSYSCFGEATGANHNLRANPRFVSTAGSDPLAWDLRLLPDSPCIDSGTTATTATQALAATDLAGNPRPGGDGLIDIGAYESPDDYTPGVPAPPVVLYVSPQGDGSTGQDWAHAFNTITSATQAVTAGCELYEIRVAAGTYREGREVILPTSRVNSLSGGWSGNPAHPEEREITQFKTIIDGGKTHRCLTNYTLLDGVWIQNGTSANDGGGILNCGTMTNCTITSSTASGDGGGIYNDHGMVTNCTVTSSSASSEGGGIYNYSGTLTNCTVTSSSTRNSGGGICNLAGTLTNCTVISSSAAYGGGIYNNHGIMTNCTVTNNSASTGGGTCNSGGTMTNCTVTRNSATGQEFNRGGGIYNNSGTVANCIVKGNSTSKGSGGGIYSESGIGDYDQPSAVTNCTVAENSSSTGGGIFNESATATNCIVINNSASAQGGGIQNFSGTVINCTVMGNTAPNVDGINNHEGFVTNSIVWRNGVRDLNGSLANVSYSCFGEATDSNHNLRANPRFVSTADSDPLAWDLRLLPDSPCIDAGTTETQSLPATDRAGNPRPGEDGRVDMGAYESPADYTQGAPAPPRVLYVSPQGDGSTGQDWSRAFNTITSATQATIAYDDLCEIRMAAGTYREGREVILPASRINSLSGGWSGNPANPNERDIAQFKTIIDGGKAHRCLTNYKLLDGLWIQNGAAADKGGGILNYGIVTNCTVTGNSSSYDGSGIYRAYEGGGIYNCGMVANCMVAKNIAAGNGGGIYNNKGTVTSCTVISNSANDGSGIFNCTTGTVTNCIVWYNSENDIIYDHTNVTYCCFGEASGTKHNMKADPRFVSMTGNDPQAWDLRLRPDSPCIDTGTTGTLTVSATDLLGNPRISDNGRIDMGAYEYNDKLGTVVIQTVPNTAPWSLTSSFGSPLAQGIGNARLDNIAVGEVTLTWGELANFDPPTPQTVSKTLVSSETLTFAGIYTPQRGSVAIDVTPATTPWSFTDRDGQIHNGSGKATVSGIPFGPITLTWGQVAGFDLPALNPVVKTLGKDGMVCFREVLLPSGEGPFREQARIIRYLLGLDGNPEGLDANADAKVDIADVLTQMNAIPPDMPTSPNPADGATTISLTPHLTWAPVRYAKSYDLYLWKEGEPVPTTPLAAGLRTTSADVPTTLSHATVYNWRVTPRNISAQTPGPVWKFTTRRQWVKLISPNGGNTWFREATVYVRYYVSSRSAGTSFRIELWRGNTKTATLKAYSSSTLGSKSEPITLDAALTPATDYKVRVISNYLEAHNGGVETWDESDQPFTIK